MKYRKWGKVGWINKEQKKAAFILLVVFIASVVIVNGTLTAAEEEYSTILSAVRTDETIIIDGQSKESSWDGTKTLIIPVVDGKVGDIDVELKALYDTDYVYMYIVWPDPTQSDTIFWIYNGTAWLPPEKTTEDIFTIFWNIRESVKGFDIAGCAITCHANRMHTNTPEEKIDYWKWKAEKGNPSGYMWDGFLDDTAVIGENIYPGFSRTFMIEKTWHSHKLDETSADYVEERMNVIVDERGNFIGPRYYEPDARDEDAKHITMEEILRDEALGFLNLTKLNDEREIPIGFKVPAYISEKPTGSARDISAKGVYYGGKWHLELKRKLQTWPDDIQFDITKTYRFSIAVNDDSHGSANEGYGQGHSTSMLARTLEFGGMASEEVTHLVLIRDYLVTAKAHIRDGKPGLALSEVNDGLTLYNEIRDEVADVDPELYMIIKNAFVDSVRNPTIINIDILIGNIDDVVLTFQGKRQPAEPTWNLKLLIAWGRIQLYVFVVLSILVIYPIYKTIKTSARPELRHLSLFLLIVMAPIFLEGLGRFGVLANIHFLQKFSFTTNEYITLLWAIGMFIALYFGRIGFNEVDDTIKSLGYYSTELETKMEELSKSQEKLLRAERLASIGQLAASIGHELRNPLGVIKNISYYLDMKLGDRDEKIKKHLRLLDEELVRSDKIISDLLDFSRGIEPTIHDVDINPVVGEALSRATIPDNVKVTTNFEDALPKISVDSEQIVRVFLNIILNAIQAMPEGGSLKIRTVKKDEFIGIEVKDTGTGISKEDVGKVFEPLFSTKAKGIGLGLALSKQIIERHDGSIEVESVLDSGTTFIVKLPIKRSQGDEED